MHRNGNCGNFSRQGGQGLTAAGLPGRAGSTACRKIAGRQGGYIGISEINEDSDYQETKNKRRMK
jgi:hypothetical protein